jgi:hypothetical protein
MYGYQSERDILGVNHLLPLCKHVGTVHRVDRRLNFQGYFRLISHP